MKINAGKCRFLHGGWNNPVQQHRVGTGWKAVPQEKALGVLEDNMMTMSWQCALAIDSQPHPGLYSQECSQQLRAVLLPLHLAPVTPQLESCCQLWVSHYKAQGHPEFCTSKAHQGG